MIRDEVGVLAEKVVGDEGTINKEAEKGLFSSLDMLQCGCLQTTGAAGNLQVPSIRWQASRSQRGVHRQDLQLLWSRHAQSWWRQGVASGRFAELKRDHQGATNIFLKLNNEALRIIVFSLGVCPLSKR